MWRARRLVEESGMDVQLQLKKCDAVDEQHARAIAKIEKDFAQVRSSETEPDLSLFFSCRVLLS